MENDANNVFLASGCLTSAKSNVHGWGLVSARPTDEGPVSTSSLTTHRNVTLRGIGKGKLDSRILGPLRGGLLDEVAHLAIAVAAVANANSASTWPHGAFGHRKAKYIFGAGKNRQECSEYSDAHAVSYLSLYKVYNESETAGRVLL